MALFLQPVFKDKNLGRSCIKNLALTYGDYTVILMKQLMIAGLFLHIQMVLIQLSMVHTGYDALMNFGHNIVNYSIMIRGNYPLLTKVLDANDKLSVQVRL